MPETRLRNRHRINQLHGHSKLEPYSPDKLLPIRDMSIPSTGQPQPEGKESWLISYIDMLTLLVTLFVLLLSYQNSLTDEGTSQGMVLEKSKQPSNEQLAVTTPSESNIETSESEEWLQLLPTTLADSENIVVEENGEELSVTLNNQLLFLPGKVAIKQDAYSTLNEVANLLIQYPHPTSIAGHTDNTPIQSTRYPSNWELSTGRATNITRYLIEQGVPAKQLRAIGYADTQPHASNETVDGRASNRRVIITLHLAQPTSPLLPEWVNPNPKNEYRPTLQTINSKLL